MKNCFICKVVCLLLVVGGLNWGLIGFFQLNAVTHFLGEGTTITRVIYDAVGIAALLALVKCFMGCPGCKKA